MASVYRDPRRLLEKEKYGRYWKITTVTCE